MFLYEIDQPCQPTKEKNSQLYPWLTPAPFQFIANVFFLASRKARKQSRNNLQLDNPNKHLFFCK